MANPIKSVAAATPSGDDLRQNNGIGLNERQTAFVALVAIGEVSVVEAYRRAGFAGDTSNANKLKKHLAQHIAAERERLGIRDEPEHAEVDDADKAELVAAQRKLYADAVASQNLPVQRAALRSLERLLRKPGKPGRPGQASAPAPVSRVNMFAHLSGDEIARMILGEEECAAIDAEYAAIDEARARWLREETRELTHLRLLPIEQQLETLIIGDDAPEPTLAAELKSSASVDALAQAQIVRRL